MQMFEDDVKNRSKEFSEWLAKDQAERELAFNKQQRESSPCPETKNMSI